MLDFIAYNRINTFVTKLVTVSETITDTNYIDNSPNGIFTGPRGTILQKRGNVLSYKYPGDASYTILNYASNSIGSLLNKYNVILNRGVNKNVTWIKQDSENGTKWENQGALANSCQICEILPSSPCVTPTVTYISPSVTTINPSPTPLPSNDCTCTYLVAERAVIKTLIVSNPEKCEPGPSTPGVFGEILVCENYMYVYDGVKWKRMELTVYY